VGAIIKKVINKARPIITWLGGRFCMARARLTKSITITIFVKEVIDITIAGAKESIVTRNKIIKERLVSLGLFASLILKLRLGMGILVSSAERVIKEGAILILRKPIINTYIIAEFLLRYFVPQILLCLIFC
jgi:hypothetical protein